MNDSTESRPDRWLVLTHHLPPEPAYLRVKVRRRLDALGALLVKSSVYALPWSDDALEDLQWLAREIVEDGGEAFLAESTFVDGITHDRLIAQSQGARETDYLDLIRAAAELGDSPRGTESVEPAAPPTAKARRLAQRLEDIKKIDFFNADGRAEAERAIEEIMDPGAKQPQSAPRSVGSGQTWVTRRGVKVDRISSAWLIKRFVDHEGRFEFVDIASYSHAANHLRFDMFEGEFTHEGDGCTFETLVARFGLDDPALRSLAEIVHDLDCKDEKFGRPEAAGVSAIIDGIARAESDDASRIARGSVFLDALYEHFRSRPATPVQPSKP